jgi:pimeloyl-ACP methyl ester carboxylesterase
MFKYTMLVSLLAALAWVAAPCQAQSLDQFYREQYGQLDKNALQTGMLINRSPVFISPDHYNGHNTADSMALSLDQFGILYGQFRGAATQPDDLPDPKVYLDRALRPYRKGDTVDLAFMAVRFEQLRSDALDRNLLEWHDGKLRDVAGRTESPYQTDTCYAFAALRPEVAGPLVHFRLPGDLLLGNLGSWGAVSIDFGDGKGFRNVEPGQTVTVHYAAAGSHILSLRYGSATAMAGFNTTPLTPGGPTGGNAVPYDEFNPEIVNLGGVTLNIFSSCDDKKIRRPLIVVEGFGGESVNFDKMFNLLKGETSSGDVLNTWLNEREYDLIWVDYNNAAASIATNAAHVAAAIDYINDRKHASGSSEPNVLIGASMGGLVCKYALLEMHNVSGKDAEVSHFFTYDSPLTGANYPIGIQAFVRDFMLLTSLIGQSSPAFQQALGLLDSPAALDMLRTRVKVTLAPHTGGLDIFNANVELITAPEFTVLQTQIANLESIRPLSGITRHIALSNGANFGVLQQSITPVMNILGLELILGGSIPIISNCVKLRISAYAHASTHVSKTIYERRIQVDYDGICSISSNENLGKAYLILPEPLGLDNAPGGISNIGLSDIEVALNAISIGQAEATVPLKAFSFIPTVSALNMPITTGIGTSTPTGGGSVARWSASNDASVTSDITKVAEFNQDHVSMNRRIADVLVDELEPEAVVSALDPRMNTGEIYNFGRATATGATTGTAQTPDVISTSINIPRGGGIWVNRNARLAYINNANNPPNANPQKFVVTVPGVSCDQSGAATVTVEEGGNVLIGDETVSNIGQLRFGKGGHLVVNGWNGVQVKSASALVIEGEGTAQVNPGGSVLVEEGGHLLIQSGSEMVLERGATLDLQNGGDCLIENNARLRVKAGAILQLSNGKSNVTIGKNSMLLIEPGAIVRLWDGQLDDGSCYIKAERGGAIQVMGDFDLTGNGYFWFNHGLYRDFRPEIRYYGHSKTCRLFFFEAGSKISPSQPVRLENLEVVGENISGFHLTNNRIFTNNVTFTGLSADAQLLFVQGNSHFSLNKSDFAGLYAGVEARNINNATACFVEDCSFSNCYNGVLMHTGRSLVCNRSEFSCAEAALDLTNITSVVNVNRCNIAGSIYGAKLEHVMRYTMSGGSVSNTDYGIYTPAESRTSVISLINQATIQNSIYGIYVENGGPAPSGGGTQNFGLVRLDCARILDNTIGIAGTDVLLQMDGGSVTRPNHFRAGADKIFDICYEDYTVDIIYARGNFWEGIPDYSWRIGNNNGDGGCSRNITKVIREPELPAAPVNCGPPPTGGRPGEALTEEGGSACPSLPTGVSLEEQFLNACGILYASEESDTTDMMPAAASLFQSLANLSAFETTELSPLCSSIIEAARAFVSYIPTDGRPSDAGVADRSANVQNNTMALQPNPANGYTTVTFPVLHQEGKITLTDIHGRTVREANITVGSTQHTFMLDALTPGVYFVRLSESGTQPLKSLRLSVVH